MSQIGGRTICLMALTVRKRSIAEFERAIIRERTKTGVAAVKARRRSGGRPAKLTGERAEHARNLLAAGTSVSAVARSMGVSRAAVHRAMERAEPARSRSSS